MNKVDAWLSKHDLKNLTTLIVVGAFILFLILLFMLMNHSDQGSNRITVSENASYELVQMCLSCDLPSRKR